MPSNGSWLESGLLLMGNELGNMSLANFNDIAVGKMLLQNLDVSGIVGSGAGFRIGRCCLLYSSHKT